MSWIETPGEECGVFGVYAPGQDAAHLISFGLFALQHRGQESAGIAVSNGQTTTVFRDMGLVSQVFDEKTLAGLPGHLGIGHTRYSTSGSTVWENAQPAYRQVNQTGIALGHNGNLTNTRTLSAQIGDHSSTTDSLLMLDTIASKIDDGRSDGRELERAAAAALPMFEGAFSIVMMDQGHLIGARDPHGYRPLCLGALPEGGWVLASETAALDIVGARFIRDIEPGELVIIDAGGVRSKTPFASTDRRLCIFEFVYFARPDSNLYGQNVHGARQRMGRTLAREAPAEADIVVPVPESGIPAAQGFSAESGLPYADGLVKNRYIGRTFIEPTQLLRDRGIRLKLNPIPENLEGQRIVLVDDSIVRGSTTRQLVKMMREAGAAEVHLRISSPPYRWPCHYGMDTADRSKLLAASLDVDEIREYLNADSLAYLSLPGLEQSAGGSDLGFCSACLSGQYPTPVPDIGDKFALEQRQ